MLEVNILERAIKDALANKDGSDFFTENYSDYQHAVSDSVERYLASKARLASRLTQSKPLLSKAESVVSATAMQLQSLGNKAISEIANAAKDFEETLAYLRAFKIQYNIKRPAKNPNKVLAFAITALLGGLEGLGNTLFFLASGSMPNFIEAAKLGFFFSYTLIFLAAVGGGFLSYRYLHESCSSFQRSFAKFGAVATLLSLALIIYSCALVRSTGSFDGLLSVYDKPALILDDLYSVMLFSLGCVVSVVAIYEGATGFSDPIPSYAGINQQVEDAKDAAYSEYDAFIENLDDTYQDAASEFEKTFNNLSVSHEDLVRHASEIDKSSQTLENECTSHYNQAIQRIKQYSQSLNSIRPNLKLADERIDPIKLPEFSTFDSKIIDDTFKQDQEKLLKLRDTLQQALQEARCSVDQAMQAFQEN